MHLRPKNSFEAAFKHLDKHNQLISISAMMPMGIIFFPLFLLIDLGTVVQMMYAGDLEKEERRWKKYYRAIRNMSAKERTEILNLMREDFDS